MLLLSSLLIFSDCISGWHLCELEVLSCKEIPWPDAEVEEKYHIEDCGWDGSKKVAYECEIDLLTGKTHQIRAQLAAIGAPIIGDSMYMPAVIAERENPCLNPFGQGKKTEFSNEDDRTKAVGNWLSKYGKEPHVAIGLQASLISWFDRVYYARTPWWKQ